MPATNIPSPPFETSFAETGVVLRDASWSDYESMLRIVGDRRVRVTYDAGTMEVVIPSQRHEQSTQLFGLIVPRLAEELGIPYEPLGMTTWKKRSAAKGLESDQCYYIEHESLVREKAQIDLEVDPPPDLAIEVDVASRSLNRLSIYADLGVPEVWRFDDRSVTFLLLQPNGAYESSATSRSFPALRPSDVERFLELGRSTDKIRWARALRDWVAEELIPRRERRG